jgi:hypothetical protein
MVNAGQRVLRVVLNGKLTILVEPSSTALTSSNAPLYSFYWSALYHSMHTASIVQYRKRKYTVHSATIYPGIPVLGVLVPGTCEYS